MSHSRGLILLLHLGNPRGGRRVTQRFHVPACDLLNRVVSRKSRRIRCLSPARDRRSACPNFSRISSMAAVASADRPARDIGGPPPLAAFRRARDRRCRSRSASRNAPSAPPRRALACLARRTRRHRAEHVLCVLAVDGCRWYQLPHSQHRRRGAFSRIPIPTSSTAGIQPRSSGHALEVDLTTAARWISGCALLKRVSLLTRLTSRTSAPDPPRGRGEVM